MTTQLLTPVEVSEMLAVPVSTLRRWRYERRGPAFVKLGRLVRYDQADVEWWLSVNRQKPRRLVG